MTTTILPDAVIEISGPADHSSLKNKGLLLLLLGLLVFGAFLRIYPTAKITGLGFDENFYRININILDTIGLAHYPELARRYVKVQRDAPAAIIPPTRVTFISAAYIWKNCFRVTPLAALRSVACLGGVLGLLVGALFLWRAAGLPAAIGGTALLSCAPLAIQLSQRPYIDGFFAFWALLSLWLLWENLHAPNRLAWLIALALSLALMIMTKENAAFVYGAVFVIIALNRWIRLGTVTAALIIATFAGALAGFIGLVVASGGLFTLIEVFRVNVSKAYATAYVIRTGDGPWFRYILDLIAISPAVTVLALASFCQWRANEPLTRYFTIFIAMTYLIMTNVKYGISLRYTAIWDLPLRWLAFNQVLYLATIMPKRVSRIFVPTAIAVLCAVDLHQYSLYFVENSVYDPVPEVILHHLHILK